MSMAIYKFLGDLNNISESQLEFIDTVIKRYGFENTKVSFQTVGEAGDNYIASVKRIIIEGDEESLSMIAKIASTNETYRKYFNIDLLFRNEHIMYTEVLPRLTLLQNKANIPEETQYRFAKCYGSKSESPNEVIILEDLTPLNFKMLNKIEPLSYKCIKSILKNFALLHSLSYVLKYKESETYDKFKVNLKDIWSSMANSGLNKQYFEGLENDVLTVLGTKYATLLKHKVADTINQADKIRKADIDSKYSIILHGDAWKNNIMFKFEGDKLVQSLIMIDYQASTVGSPVNDIMYMIFNGTDHKSRSQHFYEWITFYHSEMEKSLYNYNLKVNLVYPRHKLDADLKRYGIFLFGASVLIATVLVTKSDDAVKSMERVQISDVNNINKEQVHVFNVLGLNKKSRTDFKNMVIGLFDSFKEFGLF